MSELLDSEFTYLWALDFGFTKGASLFHIDLYYKDGMFISFGDGQVFYGKDLESLPCQIPAGHKIESVRQFIELHKKETGEEININTI